MSDRMIPAMLEAGVDISDTAAVAKFRRDNLKRFYLLKVSESMAHEGLGDYHYWVEADNESHALHVFKSQFWGLVEPGDQVRIAGPFEEMLLFSEQILL